MTDRYAALRAALANATPGPWKVAKSTNHGTRATGVWGDEGRVHIATCDSQNSCLKKRQDDAAYVAVADPATIADLLADRDRLREALEAIWKAMAERRAAGIFDVGGSLPEAHAKAVVALSDLPAPPEATP